MYLHNMGIGVDENDATWTYLLYRPAPNVLEKLPIFSAAILQNLTYFSY